MNRPQKIGVFDSGVGGLTVYKELLRLLPQESFVYLGDTARVPYGIRSAETIRKYSLQNCLFLLEKGAELIVVACNTATASALPFLQSVLKIPVLGVIEPGVATALKVTRSGRIGIIATEATIRSQVYERSLKAKRTDIVCHARAAPLFVPLVEETLFKETILTPVFEHYLAEFIKTNVDTLILGCTHYPILKSHIDAYFGGKIQLVDSALAMAENVKSYLESCGPTVRAADASPSHPIFVTDAPERVGHIADAILDGLRAEIFKVDL